MAAELIDRPAEPEAPPQAPPIQVRKIAFVLMSIAIVVLLLQFMQAVLLPLVLGAMLFYALDPAVDRLQKLYVNEVGIRVVQTPYQALNANAHAKRFVRSIKDACLSRVIPFGERHLRRTIAE